MCWSSYYPSTPQNGGKYGVNGGKFHMYPNIIKEHIKLLV